MYMPASLSQRPISEEGKYLLSLVDDLRAWPAEETVRQIAAAADAAFHSNCLIRRSFSELHDAALEFLVPGQDNLTCWKRLDAAVVKLTLALHFAGHCT